MPESKAGLFNCNKLPGMEERKYIFYLNRQFFSKSLRVFQFPL
jgi:hypothetical protein